MAFEHVTAVEVMLYGKTVGAVAPDSRGRPCYAFEYAPSWLRGGHSISPLYLPLKAGVMRFDNLAENTWRRLPAAIADALPDKFGNSLIEAKLAQLGVSPDQITALDRLVYVGNRAMGALEFRPARAPIAQPAVIDLAELVVTAREALQGSIATDRESKKALQSLLSVGVSAGGARAKAVINLDPHTGEISAGQRPAEGKEAWLLKFDGVGADAALGDSQEYGRIEYAYALMAKAAGIDMPETRLLEENGRAHFMIKRFDRSATTHDVIPKKIHMQSLCAMGHVDFNLIHTNDYASLFAVTDRLELGESAQIEAFRRMAFNHLAMNCDDHAKNFSFLMDENGIWRLAPAYDVTFAYNSQNYWLREHLMGVDGKFFDVAGKDLLRFAERRSIPYARATLKEVKQALSSWKEFAARAGLSEDATRGVGTQLNTTT